MIVWLRHLLGWMVSAFSSREDLVLENLALRQQLLALHAKRPRRRLTSLHKLFWVALRTFWSGWTKPLVLVTPRTVVSWHRAGFRLYWTWVSRARQVGGRKRGQQRGSCPDLPYGCRESDLGSAAHSRRTTQAGFRALGKERLAMDPASPERSRSREAMADVPQESSRGNCCQGLLYSPNAQVRCSVLLFRHRPRPAQDSALQCDPKSQCSLGCAAVARSVGLQTAAPILAIRPRLKVWSRCGFGSQPIRTAFRSPWQNGVAERWVGSCRRDLLDHVIGDTDGTIIASAMSPRTSDKYLFVFRHERKPTTS